MAAETIVKERPILFSGEMVKAILAGRKTQTRRVCKEAMGMGFKEPAASVHPDGAGEGVIAWWPNAVSAEETARLYPGGGGFPCPYGRVGERLWVRESWRPQSNASGYNEDDGSITITYAADGAQAYVDDYGDRMPADWTLPVAAKRGNVPSIHMPRWASRLTLEITGVRVERVQEITPDDVWAEGLPRGIYRHAIKGFHECDDGDEALTPDGRAFPAVAAFGATWDAINCVRSGGAYGWDANPWVFVISFKKL